MRLFPIALILPALLSSCAGVATPARAPAADAAAIAVPSIARPDGEDAQWWYRSGASLAHARGAGQARARNLILFVGDGMSLPTVAAARILAGQRLGHPGEEHQLSFETFPHTAFSRTYNTDSQVPDSAGTMTAMATGVKSRKGVISVGPAARRGDCAAGRDAELPTLLELAEVAGLATGIVTTTRLTHATPAASYAHVAEREWEHDDKLDDAARAAGCRDIARQFVEFDLGDGIDVALGGGRSRFLPSASGGRRRDGRDLLAQWRQRHPQGRIVATADELEAVDPARSEPLLGLFAPEHLAYEHDRRGEAAGEPSLARMTRAAIELLRRRPAGFVLIVEAGRIDHAHHAGNAYRALGETIALADAVRVATELTDAEDTLILVTADHAHTLGFAGYPRRGNPILGKVIGASDEDAEPGLARDALGLPYTTLGYANGPGYSGASAAQAEGPKRFEHRPAGARPSEGRPDLTSVDTEAPDYLQESAMPLGSETHGGDDVGIWALGPGASAVRGSVEQTHVFHVLLQSQPRLVALLCRLDSCERGVPVRLPTPESLRRANRR